MTVEESPLTLGEYIRRLRRRNAMSLDALAKATALSYTHLSRIESDSTTPSADSVAKIATALDGDLKMMLELGKCLPATILARIAGHDSSQHSTLARSVYRDQPEGQAPDPSGPLFAYARARGLTQEEAAEMEATVDTLCSLPPDKRRHLVSFLRGMFHEGDDATG